MYPTCAILPCSPEIFCSFLQAVPLCTFEWRIDVITGIFVQYATELYNCVRTNEKAPLSDLMWKHHNAIYNLRVSVYIGSVGLTVQNAYRWILFFIKIWNISAYQVLDRWPSLRSESSFLFNTAPLSTHACDIAFNCARVSLPLLRLLLLLSLLLPLLSLFVDESCMVAFCAWRTVSQGDDGMKKL